MRSLAFCIWLLLFSNAGFSQDPHFSQYFASPLSINPANTGFIDGPYRFTTNYRQQWWNVGENYSTTSASLDFNFYANRSDKDDKFGLGMMAIQEESLNGILNSTYIAVSTAYHKSLSADNKNMLGVGVQLSACNKTLDYSKLTFASQFNGKGFDPTIPVDIGISSNTTSYLDVNLGVLYFSSRNWGNYYAGASVYHVTTPTETLFSSGGNPLNTRNTIHAGGTAYLSGNFNLLFSAAYMTQNKIKDRLVGSALEMLAGNNSRFHLGLWYRVEDSIIPYAGVDLGGISLGMNYGIATPQINNYRPVTMEFSLIIKKLPINKLALCPRF